MLQPPHWWRYAKPFALDRTATIGLQMRRRGARAAAAAIVCQAPWAFVHQCAHKLAPTRFGSNSIAPHQEQWCKTVRILFGKMPKFGSGTYSRIGSNTLLSKSLRPRDMSCIVDDSQNGIAATSVSPNSRNIEVLKNCSGIVAR